VTNSVNVKSLPSRRQNLPLAPIQLSPLGLASRRWAMTAWPRCAAPPSRQRIWR
jgi:hypothetical protein